MTTKNSVVKIQNLIMIHKSWTVKSNPAIFSILAKFENLSFYISEKMHLWAPEQLKISLKYLSTTTDIFDKSHVVLKLHKNLKQTKFPWPLVVPAQTSWLAWHRSNGFSLYAKVGKSFFSVLVSRFSTLISSKF